MDKMKTSIFTTVGGNKTTSIYLIYLSADLSILFPSVKIQKIQCIIGCREQKIICIIHFDYKRIMYYIYCMCLYWQNLPFLDILYKIERKVIPYRSLFKLIFGPLQNTTQCIHIFIFKRPLACIQESLLAVRRDNLLLEKSSNILSKHIMLRRKNLSSSYIHHGGCLANLWSSLSMSWCKK